MLLSLSRKRQQGCFGCPCLGVLHSTPCTWASSRNSRHQLADGTARSVLEVALPSVQSAEAHSSRARAYTHGPPLRQTFRFASDTPVNSSIHTHTSTGCRACHAGVCHRYEEDEERRERFYYSMLGGGGAPPASACPDVARLVVQQHFNCPSAWCILPLQVRPAPAVALGVMRVAVWSWAQGHELACAGR